MDHWTFMFSCFYHSRTTIQKTKGSLKSEPMISSNKLNAESKTKKMWRNIRVRILGHIFCFLED